MRSQESEARAGGAKSAHTAPRRVLTEAQELHSLQTTPEVARNLQCADISRLERQIAELDQALAMESPDGVPDEGEVTELIEGQRLLSQLQAELLLAQAEGELLGAEAAEDQGAPSSLHAEVASLATALSERQAEVRNLEARRAQAEDDVRLARQRVTTFEVWSHAAHVELRQVATEFAEEREAEAKEQKEAARRCASARPLQAAVAHGGALDLPRPRVSEVSADAANSVCISGYPLPTHSAHDVFQELWCRKVPPQQGLSNSSSAPTLR